MKKMLRIIFLCVILTINILYLSAQEFYHEAFSVIHNMLNENMDLDYQKAVFITENAYFDDELSEMDFDKTISFYSSICNEIMKSGNISYPETDTQKASAQCAVFVFMMDTIPMKVGDNLIHSIPFSYNFDDFAGKKDWSNMFVTTLLESNVGNCHSLPILYKLIMNKLGEEAFLALAPNHLYIKVNNNRVGWYNIELTNGDFPTDAWLMASGYIHIDAIRNGIYMKTLTDKESVAMCLIDLAQGYQRKFGINNDKFIIKCCDTALEYFPNYINALILKAETMTSLYHSLENEKEKEQLFSDMNTLYTKIHDLGYRKMPENMYLNWLNSMGTMTTNHRIKSLIYQTDDIQ